MLSGRAVKKAETDPNAPMGFNDLASLKKNLEQYARDFGVQYESMWFTKKAAAIMNPRSGVSMSDVLQEMTAASESKNPYFKGRLGVNGTGDGMSVTTLRDAAGDYVGAMSRLLEIGEGDVDMNDQLFNVAFNSGVEPDGKAKPMSLYEFENKVREDPRWRKTKNAEDNVYRRASSILDLFGM